MRLGKDIERLLSAATFAEAGEQEFAREVLRGGRSIVAAVVNGSDASPTLTYSVNAAVRNNARLDILYVDGSVAGNARLSTKDEELVRSASIPFRLITAAGLVKDALLEHARREKNVLFFVVEPSCLTGDGTGLSGASLNRFAEALGRPLVQVESPRIGREIQARKELSMSLSSGRKKPVGKMLVMGLISIALYTYLLANQDQVNNTFGKGGWYAFLPIIVAFVFSFVHGAFTGDFWTVLGIEAARKKKEVQ